jgi:PAS domain S-box-containing protein
MYGNPICQEGNTLVAVQEYQTKNEQVTLTNQFRPLVSTTTPRPIVSRDRNAASQYSLWIGGLFILLVAVVLWGNLLWRLGWTSPFPPAFLGLGTLMFIGVSLLGWAGFMARKPTVSLPRVGPATPLARSEEHQFRRILETIDLVPWEADIWNWRFLYVGPQAEELLGYPLERWCEPGFFIERLHPQDKAVVMERCQWSCKNRATVQLEYRMKHADGHWVWVHDLVTAPRSLSGLRVFRGCLIDITERKQAEQALRESEERFRKFFELGQIGMAITSVDKKWLQVNDQLCAMLGYSLKELRKKTWAELTVPEDLASDEVLFQRVLAGELDGYSLEKRYVRKDGAIVFVYVSVRCLRKEDGSVDYFLGLLQDITDRKELEKKVVQAEKMQAIARVAGNAAHDFNNILFAIGGYAATMQTRGLPAAAIQDIAEINKAVNRAKNLARQLLGDRRSEEQSGHSISLNAFLHEIQKLIATIVPENIQCQVELGSIRGSVLVDKERLERAVVNLIVNAMDAMPEGGKLTLTTREVDLNEADCRKGPELKPGKYAVLEVRDTGMGMSEEVRTRAFEPFFTTKGSKGTGLGLYGVYGTIKQYGGHIDLQSKPGQGTTFTLYFPLRDWADLAANAEQPAVTAAKDAVPVENKRQTRTVLVVDDENIVRPVYRRLLESEGYAVVEAESGAAALRAFDQGTGNAIDLVVTDVNMPDMSGFELGKLLRAKRPNLEILFVTGYIDPTDPMLETISMDRLLQKPFLPGVMLEKVRGMIDCK